MRMMTRILTWVMRVRMTIRLPVVAKTNGRWDWLYHIFSKVCYVFYGSQYHFGLESKVFCSKETSSGIEISSEIKQKTKYIP
jgi:hypothetical protein